MVINSRIVAYYEFEGFNVYMETRPCKNDKLAYVSLLKGGMINGSHQILTYEDIQSISQYTISMKMEQAKIPEYVQNIDVIQTMYKIMPLSDYEYSINQTSIQNVDIMLEMEQMLSEFTE